ncbi:MAG: cell division protein ZapA [Pseudomonadota bacterium]
MSQVTLHIGGISYTVACADGQEAHVARLGAMIDEKYAQLGESKAPRETQNLVFAALFLADELDEIKSTPQPGSTPAPAPPPVAEAPDEEKPKGKKAELRAEIEELRQESQRLEAERDALAKELRTLQPGAGAQVDMFGDDVLAARLEALADRAESFAEALESGAPTP